MGGGRVVRGREREMSGWRGKGVMGGGRVVGGREGEGRQ